ncbi:glycosyltransferase family 39 protein [Luteolibacter pohnpeiensis]|uniref:Glycosyltransferase family 39 protein n=1 Tax=Luteolibacter pohnpeiensis TaxID=454153 RepID=A0A934VWN8_9BACT|nr:glycosyltransferase family 39 protein [Luteolibacter pohnpeiensis]MBK1883475.1 glycosyltransferase family 39 protein [Luteolibacter pohnpeiensis]
MSNSSSVVDTGTLIRRILFFLVMVLLALGNLFTLFGGLTSPQAMDQAQIAREIARGNGFTTKFIRPVAYYQASQAKGGAVPFDGFKDTYESPLNPLINAAVFKLIGADDADAWKMGPKEMVYQLDRVVATVCVFFFLLSIGVTYLLVSRIFDAKIAGVTALLMLFCETFWNYSLSGLPQMLMLFLFSCAIYFAYRAVEASSEGRSPFVPAIVAGVFFTLLALAHWMTVWIALGYIIYAAVAFRPRGVIGISVIVLILLASIYPMIRASDASGTPFGTAFLTVYNGLASGSEETVMRTDDLETAPLSLDGLTLKTVRSTLIQFSQIIPFLAGILVAPVFFLSLLHPFKRAAIANFRWLILLMFVGAAVGLALYGITSDPLDPNQIHLLFAPVMTAYGLAFISILWSRLEIVAQNSFLKNAHLFVIVTICAAPLAIAMPTKAIAGIRQQGTGGLNNWPPYRPDALNIPLRQWIPENELIVSDQPWAVAWYADRKSIWIPPTAKAFKKYEEIGENFQTPIGCILISPTSHEAGGMAGIAYKYRDFTSLVIDGRVAASTLNTKDTASAFQLDQKPDVQEIARRYHYRFALVPLDLVIYMDRPLRLADEASQ